MTNSQSELRYRRLFETIQVGILLLDYKTQTITDANPFIAKFSGYKINELVGKKISELELFDKQLTGKKIFDDLKTKDNIVYDNISLLTKDGLMRIIELSAHTYESEGSKRIQCIVWDHTESRFIQQELFETNERLEALMNALPVGVTFSLDTKCIDIELNQYMEKMMELPSGEHITATAKETLIMGHKYRHFMNGREVKPSELTMQQAISKNKVVGPFEIEVELLSGKRWLHAAIGAPIHDPKGNVVGAVAVNMDLTERKKADEAVKLAQIVAQEKEKISFIADAAHELRTPLAIIRGNVELALARKTNADDALRAINSEVIHLTSLLSDLSLLTTKESEFRRNMSSNKMSIKKLLTDVSKRHRSMAQEKNIKIHVGKLPLEKIAGDEYYLERLFTNVISNAIAYGRESGNIWVEGRVVKKCIYIEISDDGVGISEKDLSHVFDRFYRAENSRSKDYGGSGLGLSIVKWIAEAHNGSVEVTSILDKGTTFTVSLPIAK